MKKRNIKLLALCSVLAALGVVILFLGSMFELLDLSAAIFASLLITVAVIEGGSYWPWLTYAVTAVIALLLLPIKFAAVAFTLSGYYPIVKEKLEKLKNRPLVWTIKLVIFNLALTALLFVLKAFLPGVDISLVPGAALINYIVLYLLGNSIFVMYDILLTRIVTFYILRLRDKLKINKK